MASLPPEQLFSKPKLVSGDNAEVRPREACRTMSIQARPYTGTFATKSLSATPEPLLQNFQLSLALGRLRPRLCPLLVQSKRRASPLPKEPFAPKARPNYPSIIGRERY
jgi:hypothetical protein